MSHSEISVVASGATLQGPREHVGSAYAVSEGGRLVFGRAGADTEVPPLLCLDDRSILVGDAVWDRDDVVHGIVWSALQGAGIHERLDLLEIAYPSTWGDERRELLRAVFATSASEVVVVETAIAAVASAGERAPAAAVVIEVGTLDTTVVLVDEARTHGGDIGAVLAVGERDDSWRRRADDYLRSSVSQCPEDIFIVAESGSSSSPAAEDPARWLTGLDVARSLYRRAGAEVETAPPGRAAAGRSAAWLDEVTVAVPPPRRSGLPVRVFGAVAASVIVAGGVVALTFVLRSPQEVAVATSPPFEVPATQAVSTTESTSATEAAPTTETTPTAETNSATAVSATSESPSVIPSSTFVSGRASLRLPATWTRMEDPARMVLIPPTAPERRIVVTVQELVPGSTLEQVASELGAAVDARGPDSPIGSLEPARDFGGRVGISYVERPADASTVLWRVLVESDVQVSIGCQFEGSDSSAIDTECDLATQTLEIVPMR
ncbi:type VII secretion-associated protein [Rhodococcus fascians]|uniref:type VII secretion-associated protein n=1 Tax=Rhodococcoides fascians TaxID=1828 RepID=UPI001961E1D1|nr:type VII secretion-associated protein [Rhodococcus fascians]MBM7244878.1 type VII secretion-associated protein [Rhodococcus fascians]MBY3810811.1 type VII secretion-associated protein [Rhodococcus fascians]MBY3842276.1 type VII secretion-associated protein [Rhodococcus fascians]MBY3848192.1 type VII secretion-associated protein [Rhodococcus fascians]MBY3852505.1 type VII secretion-associated protein [Rhodococcus fascians]